MAMTVRWIALVVLLVARGATAAPVDFEVQQFHIVWAADSDLLPSLEPAMKAAFRLKRTPRGFTAAVAEAPAMRTDLASLARHNLVRIDDVGLESIASAISDRMKKAGLLGISIDIGWAPASHTQGADRGDIWFLVDAPLEGASTNDRIPDNLVTLKEMRVATTPIEHIDLAWRGDVPHLPTATAFLDHVDIPVNVRGGRVLVDANASTTVGRLRRFQTLDWSPAAITALNAAVQASMVQLGDDVTTTVTTSQTPAANGGADLKFTAHVVMTTPQTPASTSPDTLATVTPTPQPPASTSPDTLATATPTPTPTVTTPSAPPAPPAPPTPLPVPIGTEIDGVEITWSDPADDTWGAAALLFDVTQVHLRQVDDSIQAGTDETTDALNVTNLGDMQGLRWRPSATRALLQAMEARLQDLGMARSSLSYEFTTTDGRRVLEVSLEVPPRDARMPTNSTQHEIDGTRVYPVWPFEVGYFSPHPDLPPVSVFMNLDLALSSDGSMWNEAAENEANSMTVTLGQLNESGPMCFSPQAIRAINTQLGDVLIDDGLLGVRVAPASSQIVAAGPQEGDDLRTGTGLQLGVDVGRVAEIRTLAAGDRISEDDRVDHEKHTDIASGSPLQAPNGDKQKHGDLLRQEQLDDYLYFLSRHPGRDVEASVASSQFVGGISLEYTVSEAKPWTAWFQYGNTGTQSDGYQRYRFGYYTTQATGNDDILSLQYVTSNFSDTNAVMGSYEAPIGLDGRLRAGVNGSWSQYFADQFGVFGPGSFFDNAFNGYSWSGAGELRWNAYQEGAFFVDVIGGTRLQHLSTTNNIFDIGDQASFLVPYGMLRADRAGEWSQFEGVIGLEGNVLSHSTDTLEIISLRENPAKRWIRFNGQVSFSTYLEPLIDSDSWSDPSTPKTSTLAHELYGKVSGQYSFGNRLMPQFQEVVGGPGTNRGYPVYIVAGDDVLNVTGEYRFHLPRTFDPNPTPSKLLGEPFRMAPQYVYGRPDWDLVLLGFIDASWVGQADSLFYENGETLVSAGVGLDLILKTNFRVRLDWGWALESLQNGLYDAGQNRLYVQASLYF